MRAARRRACRQADEPKAGVGCCPASVIPEKRTGNTLEDSRGPPLPAHEKVLRKKVPGETLQTDQETDHFAAHAKYTMPAMY